MKGRFRSKAISPFVVLILVVLGCGKSGPPPIKPPHEQGTSLSTHVAEMEINGSLEEVNGMRVLRLWGSHQEMGYAHGYLLAGELVEVIEQGLFDGMFSSLPGNWTYEQMARIVDQKILWPEGYREETDAMVEGMEAALGGTLPEITHERIEAGSAVVESTMLAVLNASHDLVDLSLDCCGFAAWGEVSGCSFLSPSHSGLVHVGGTVRSDRRLRM